ncbi:MAG: hypothetical protein FWC27_11815 [Firmicutes bacterium]|nr:hypothetical protein [Bacillota bacterium]
MTTHERILRMYEHREADRVPIVDSPWRGTVARWQREGMPEGVAWQDYFGADKLGGIGADISPRYERKILEETDRWRIETTSYGVTLRQFKDLDATPEFLDFKVNTADAWADAKRRMQDLSGRVDWKRLARDYPQWKAEGRWLSGGFWFGFDVAHSGLAGTETLLIAMLEEPEWVTDIFDTYLTSCEALFDQIWDAGYTFDEMMWYDDLGYKGTTFFSPELYRQLVQPFHKRAVDWAHRKGIYARLHSCGDVRTLLPDIVATGVDALNPLEAKAGMDALQIKRDYGGRLLLHGGINAVLWEDRERIVAEIERLVPQLKENGGYIFASDHSIPSSVSLENFRAIIETVKRCGGY